MGNKDYIHDIHDTFEGKKDSKEALKLVNKIKSSQKLAYPNQEYKENLKNRLESVYILDQAIDAPSRFSIFQVFGVVTSFVFIFGLGYIMFDARQNIQQVIYQNLDLEQKQGVHIIKKELEGRGNLEPEIEKNDYTIETKTIPQKIYKESNEVPNTTSENTSIKNTRLLDIPQVISGSEETYSDEDLMQENEPFFPSPTSSRMMMDFVGKSYNKEESFVDICNEHDGIISSSERYCIFPDGRVCEKIDIYQCIEDKNNKEVDRQIEIDLQELIDEYGQ